MTVENISDDIGDAGEKLIHYAFSQGKNGKVDLTLGKRYVVYGVRENELGKFYLVLTDTINTKLPWWMPAKLFKVVDKTIPKNWSTHINTDNKGTETILAIPDYYDASTDIEDGTKKGFNVFQDMRKEPDILNQQATVRDLLYILRSGTENLNINWEELLGSKETLGNIIRAHAPKYEYLLADNVTVSDYDRETLIEDRESTRLNSS